MVKVLNKLSFQTLVQSSLVWGQRLAPGLAVGLAWVDIPDRADGPGHTPGGTAGPSPGH